MAQGLGSAPRVRTGYRCNSRCRFCDQAELRLEAAEPSVEAVARAIDEACSQGPPRVLVLAGGEVTLRSELTAWIAQAMAGGVERVVLQTNGRMLAYKRYVSGLLEAGNVVFAVALHGHLALLHDWLTRVPGSFDEAVRGMEHAHALGAPLLVNTVVTRSNYRHLSEIVALAGRLGARGGRLLWPRPEGDARAAWSSLAPPRELVAPYLERALRVARSQHLRFGVDWETESREAAG